MIFYQPRHWGFQNLGNLEMKLSSITFLKGDSKVMGNASYKTKHRDFFFQR